MLPRACRWQDSPDASHLYYNYGCVAVVRQRGEVWDTLIMWQGREHKAPAGSREQGKRWVERWVSAVRGLPGLRKRLR